MNRMSDFLPKRLLAVRDLVPTPSAKAKLAIDLDFAAIPE
jgi:hypothetical protein